MRLYLVRHLAVPAGAGICYGRLDLPAAAPTPAQIAALHAALPASAAECNSPASAAGCNSPALAAGTSSPASADGCSSPASALWFSSPAQRCQSLAYSLHANPVIAPALQELDFGRWEACAWSNIGAAALDAWITAGYDGAAHGGESLATLQQRVWHWADTQAAHLAPSQAVVAITHAGVIRALWSRTMPFEACLRRAVPHGVPIVLDWPPAGLQPG